MRKVQKAACKASKRSYRLKDDHLSGPYSYHQKKGSGATQVTIGFYIVITF